MLNLPAADTVLPAAGYPCCNTAPKYQNKSLEPMIKDLIIHIIYILILFTLLHTPPLNPAKLGTYRQNTLQNKEEEREKYLLGHKTEEEERKKIKIIWALTSHLNQTSLAAD